MPESPHKHPFADKEAPVTDAAEILDRLSGFVDLRDYYFENPLDLLSAIFKRVKLADDIKRVEESTSWDYCKQAAIDWYKKTRRWLPIHASAFEYQIGCVPADYILGGIILTGEAYSGEHHLALANVRGGYWCCMLSRREMQNPEFIFNLEFAKDLPMMGFPKDDNAED